MKIEKFNVAGLRFHMTNNSILVIWGWKYDMEETDRLEAALNQEQLSMEVEKYEGMEVRQRYLNYDLGIQEEYILYVKLPKRWEEGKYLTLCVLSLEEQRIVYKISSRELQKLQSQAEYFVEQVEMQQGDCIMNGWAAGVQQPRLQIKDRKNRDVDCVINWSQRKGIGNSYKETEICPDCGFQIIIPKPQAGMYLVIHAGERKSTMKIPVVLNQILEKLPIGRIAEKGIRFLMKNGWKSFFNRVRKKIFTEIFTGNHYKRYCKAVSPSEEELKEQRMQIFEYEPVFSIVVPLYKTPQKYLEQLVGSVKRQTYGKWELCLSDGSGSASPLQDYLKELQQRDVRIKNIYGGETLQISQNTNQAMEQSTGDFIIFADHDDLLAENALYECVKAINEKTETELIYSDEDKVSMNGRQYFQPHFKSDFNLDLLCSMNYFCHLVAVKRELANQAGYLRPEYDGAQDYDFVLRCVELTQHIYHIPKVLYHWRAHADSTAENPESKRYAFEAGKRAVQAHYDRMGIPAKVEEGVYPGLYRTAYMWKEQPLISILIPNRDHREDLEKCISSIEEKSFYRNYEFIIIENNSEEEQTFAYYKQLELENEKVHVVYFEGEFNYSAINNFGAEAAKGEYLLLLNNDTEIINPDCLWQMLGYCMREDVGIVGARLYYPDNTIQHAGVVIGFGGIAGHAFVGFGREENGYFSRIICAQNYSAVTAACMMTRKSVYEQVGGLTEGLKVAFNDIDYCMKVRAAGKLIVYNPAAELYHYESKSRGLEDSAEKKERYYREMEYFAGQWPDIMKHGDPYYNPNLSLLKADFSLGQS